MRRSRADNDANHMRLTRRAALLGGAQLLFMGGLAARMRYLQVDQADQFRLLAEENRINISTATACSWPTTCPLTGSSWCAKMRATSTR